MRSTPPAHAPKVTPAQRAEVLAYRNSPQYQIDKAAAFASYNLERDAEDAAGLH